MTVTIRQRLTALVAARTKLDAASKLVKEATADIAASGLFPAETRKGLRAIASQIDVVIGRVAIVIEKIP